MILRIILLDSYHINYEDFTNTERQTFSQMINNFVD